MAATGRAAAGRGTRRDLRRRAGRADAFRRRTRHPGPGAGRDQADRENDVLVVGAGRPGLRRAFSRRVSRHCLAHAVCPVLAVPRLRSSRSCRPSTDATRGACASTSASCDRGPARVAPGLGDTVPSTTASQPSGRRQRGTLPAARGSTVFPWSTATTPAPWQPAGTRPAPRPWRTTATGPVRYAVPSATPSRCSACCCVWTGRPAR
ncbi:universal stress protein [Streptomyces achromogenes]|uniref:universal stress protein n=1 Tax=Streptomyces achromogenes TaxID=67255 RepID=UPI0036F6FE49